MDLRFEDGHLERRLGPGSLREEGVQLSELVEWGEEVVDLQGMVLSGEIARDYREAAREAMKNAPVEIVVEWHADSLVG